MTHVDRGDEVTDMGRVERATEQTNGPDISGLDI